MEEWKVISREYKGNQLTEFVENKRGVVKKTMFDFKSGFKYWEKKQLGVSDKTR